VDDLMPLVDTMKDQFGLEQATAFNNVVKQQLQTVLDSIIAAKDQTDNAINTMETGGMPAAPSDIGQPLPPMGGVAPAAGPAAEPAMAPAGEPAATDMGADTGAEGEIDFEKEFAASPATAGPEEEALGRAKKEVAESVNFDDRDLDQLKKFTNLEDMKRKALDMIRPKGARAMKPEKIAWFSSAINNASSPSRLIKLMYDMLLSGEGHAVVGSKHSMQPNKYRQTFGETEQPTQTDLIKMMAVTGKTADGKKTLNPTQKLAAEKAAKSLEQANLEEAKKIKSPYAIGMSQAMKQTGDKPPLKKSTITKAHGIARGIVSDLKESREQVRALKQQMDQDVAAYYAHVGTLKESWISQQGDLRSAVLQAKVIASREQLQEAIAEYKQHKEEFAQHVLMQEQVQTKLRKLEEQMSQTPYGVKGQLPSGATFRKFFESAELRDTWIRYNRTHIQNVKHVTLSEMQQVANRLRKLI